MATVNSSRDAGLSMSQSNWQGQFLASRTSSSALAFYKNGSLYSSGTDNATTIPNTTLKLNSETLNQVSIAFVGAGFNSTDAIAIMGIINTYMKKIRANVY